MSRPSFSCSVRTEYLAEQSDPTQGVYAYAYTIVIVNDGDIAAQLIGRHWQIVDATGKTEEVRGLGVVGHQPLLQPGERFEYTSWTRLETPQGRMRGSYFCMTEDARWFETPIPAFELGRAQTLH